MTRVFICIGVAGSGKTAVGEALAKQLGVSYFDADDFHTVANKNKMRSGSPLNDDDRKPWLERIAEEITKHIQEKSTVVFSCSGLKKRYRDVLRGNHSKEDLVFYLLERGYRSVEREDEDKTRENWTFYAS